MILKKVKDWMPVYGICFLVLLYLITSNFKGYLLINISESMPKGLYFLSDIKKEELKVGDIILFTCPSNIEKYVYGRKYLPKRIPLLKRIAGVKGTIFFMNDGYFYINNKKVARIKSHDKQLLELPVFYTQEIQEVQENYFIVLGDHENSFDSRYFGEISLNLVKKKAKPVWTI